MSTQSIIEKLDRLAELRSAIDAINLRYDELRNTVLTPEIRASLKEIEDERYTALDAAQAGLSDLENEIKAGVIIAGESVKGAWLHAIYSKPKVTWDNKGLSGFAVAHPEINAFRKIGECSVSIRQAK